MKLINTAILAHPWNWIVIALIALFWLVFIVVVTKPSTPGVQDDASSPS